LIIEKIIKQEINLERIEEDMNGNIEDEYKKESSDNEIIESKSCKLKI
jgi:hypothetical protein